MRGGRLLLSEPFLSSPHGAGFLVWSVVLTLGRAAIILADAILPSGTFLETD